MRKSRELPVEISDDPTSEKGGRQVFYLPPSTPESRGPQHTESEMKESLAVHSKPKSPEAGLIMQKDFMRTFHGDQGRKEADLLKLQEARNEAMGAEVEESEVRVKTEQPKPKPVSFMGRMAKWFSGK